MKRYKANLVHHNQIYLFQDAHEVAEKVLTVLLHEKVGEGGGGKEAYFLPLLTGSDR